MSRHEDTEKEVPPLEINLAGEHDSQTKTQRIHQKTDSDRSKLSSGSMKSDRSRDPPITFEDESLFPKRRKMEQPGSSLVSMKSDLSKDFPKAFKKRNNLTARADQESPGLAFAQSAQEHQKDLDAIFRVLEENVITFVKNELKNIQRGLSLDDQQSLDSQSENEEALEGEDEEQMRSNKEAFRQITQHFLRRMGKEELADLLQCSNPAQVSQHKLKTNLKRQFQCVFEGIPKEGNPTPLNKIYTYMAATVFL